MVRTDINPIFMVGGSLFGGIVVGYNVGLSSEPNPYADSFSSEYQKIGFNFTENGAKKKAHHYIFKMAKEVSKKHGLTLIDKTCESAGKLQHKKLGIVDLNRLAE